MMARSVGACIKGIIGYMCSINKSKQVVIDGIVPISADTLVCPVVLGGWRSSGLPILRGGEFIHCMGLFVNVSSVGDNEASVES